MTQHSGLTDEEVRGCRIFLVLVAAALVVGALLFGAGVLVGAVVW